MARNERKSPNLAAAAAAACVEKRSMWAYLYGEWGGWIDEWIGVKKHARHIDGN